MPPCRLQFPWLYLLIAGLFEVGWAIGLKYTEGLSVSGLDLVLLRPWLSV